MKSVVDLKNILKTQKPYLKEKYKIKSISIFGSYSRDEATPESDVDILVDFEEPIGLEFVDLADELEELLEVNVDLVSKNGVKERYFKVIERDLVHV